MCVEICPEVFEKPVANQCARVRSDANPALYVSRIREAAESCPVNAIEIQLPEDLERCA
jgi:ferredoxin